jgi:REP-associated tyrosine transposase
MPRKPRFVLPGVPMHVVQRGHSREPVFFETEDYEAYLTWLKEGAQKYGCAIHAYVLMANHVHILATPSTKDGVTRMMQLVGRHYVPYINRTYGTSGSLWEGRYKASLVDSEAYLLACMRYIELNPVRAKMVRGPSRYRWSSYRFNGQGAPDPLVTPHPLYQALGRSKKTRLLKYKDLFKERVDQDLLDKIRAALQTGTPLGTEAFRVQVERDLRRTVGHARRGRPLKSEPEKLR